MVASGKMGGMGHNLSRCCNFRRVYDVRHFMQTLKSLLFEMNEPILMNLPTISLIHRSNYLVENVYEMFY